VNGPTTNGASGGRRFPDGFLWGAGTSAYQIEGAVNEDGRGRSIWDVFTHTPGAVRGGETGDVACDSYHRVGDDVACLAALGVGAYRFSIAWSRVLPSGRGPVNQAGLDYYRALVDELRAHGIVPVATVYHWELPQALEDEGGWACRDTAELLAQYAAVVADALGDRVGMWTTLNEPQQSVHQGYRVGTHAPGHRDLGLAAAAAHHILLGHGLALQALRSALPARVPVGIALDPHPYRAMGEDAKLVATRLDADHNRICVDPVLHGTYPAHANPELLPPDALIREATSRRSAPRWTSSASTTTGPTTSAAGIGPTYGSGRRRCPTTRALSSISRPSAPRP
jgi:beta-glucosidase